MYGTLPLLLTPFNHTIKLHLILGVSIYTSVQEICHWGLGYIVVSTEVIHKTQIHPHIGL